MISADFKTLLPKHLPGLGVVSLNTPLFEESVSRRLAFSFKCSSTHPYLTNAEEIRGLAESRE